MKKIFYILILQFLFSLLNAEIIIFKDCKSNDYKFEKNEYKIDIDKGIMTREFVYTD